MDPLRHRSLAHFLAVYRHRQLGRAAEAEFVTQPAMTKSIQKLEAALNVPLFERGTRGAEPTKFGHVLFRHAQAIETELRFAATEIASVTDGYGGAISLGIGPALSLSVFTPFLAELQKRYPRVQFDVVTGVRDRLLPRVLKGDLDIWIGSLYDTNDVKSLEVVQLAEVEMALYCRPGHPLMSTHPIPLANLANARWAFFRDDDHGPKILEQLLLATGIEKIEEGLRSDSVAQLFATAALTDLVVYAAETLAEEAYSRGLKRLEIDSGLWRFPVGLAFKPSVRSLLVLQELIELMSKSTFFENQRGL